MLCQEKLLELPFVWLHKERKFHEYVKAEMAANELLKIEEVCQMLK